MAEKTRKNQATCASFVKLNEARRERIYIGDIDLHIRHHFSALPPSLEVINVDEFSRQ